jgi:integrase
VSIERHVRRGRTRWLVRWREEGRQRGRTFDRKTDAEDFEREQRRRAQLGAHTPRMPSHETLREWLHEWWTAGAPTWAASTRITRAAVLDRWVAPYLGEVRLADLGATRIRRWRAEAMADGMSPHMANQGMSVLSAALGAAQEAGHLPANSCSGIRRVPHAAARPRALTPLEVERIRAAMPTMRDVVLVGLLAYAGLRPEEALALTWGSVGRVLVVDRAYSCGEHKGTKTNQRRSVEVLPPLERDLALLRPKVADPEALVAPGTRGGFLNLRNWRERVWRPACEQARVRATPYDGRHTYASLLIHEGRSPLLVAAALGHASGELVWRRYGHVFEEARLAPDASMVDAVEAARAELERSGVHPVCTEAPVRVLRAVRPPRRKPA